MERIETDEGGSDWEICIAQSVKYTYCYLNIPNVTLRNKNFVAI